jgi:6-phosphogluconate dehydrogenase
VAIVKVGVIGLGRMGNAIAYRLVNGGHEVVGFDNDARARTQAKEAGIAIARDLKDLASRVSIFWVMVPAGPITDAVINQLLDLIKDGDIVVDGGNSFYKDSVIHAEKVSAKRGFFLDCGTSGGVRGREDGFCLMVGGNNDVYDQIEPLLEAISVPGGYAHVGPTGAGHYVKMVHNGIEYGLMQAYAEGFHLLRDGTYEYENIDLHQIAALWNKNAVIRSFLLELTTEIFAQDQLLEAISGEVAESGMGKWTVDEAHAHDVPVRVIEESLKVRAWSRETGGNFATKIVAMMRKKFGGHSVKKSE